MPDRYFDHNATTRLCEAAREAWIEANASAWQNPSSLYREAGQAKRRLEDAREWLGDRLGVEPECVVFTSGATEANNAVLAHARRQGRGDSVAIAAIEHPSVRAAAREWFGSEGVRELPVDETGVLDVDRAREILEASEAAPALVSVMAANNETGVLQPWEALALACRERGIPYHCDAAQWIGKRPLAEMGEKVDFLTGCAHKFGGPKGTGFLVIPEAAEGAFRFITGGPQESGHRGGTEDLPGILAMVAALREKTDGVLEENEARWLADRDRFESCLQERLSGVRLVGSEVPRLWNTSMFVLPRHPNLKWLTRLSDLGFGVSTGSACSAGRGNPSRVMEAMGLDYEEMGRVIRVSGGWETGSDDWEALLEALVTVSDQLDSGTRRGG